MYIQTNKNPVFEIGIVVVDIPLYYTITKDINDRINILSWDKTHLKKPIVNNYYKDRMEQLVREKYPELYGLIVAAIENKFSEL